MSYPHAVDVFHMIGTGSPAHAHLMAVGTLTEDSEGRSSENAISVRNVSPDGDVCEYLKVMLVVRLAVCPICRKAVLAITPDCMEASLPEGKMGP